jgi:hypothetical protein
VSIQKLRTTRVYITTEQKKYVKIIRVERKAMKISKCKEEKWKIGQRKENMGNNYIKLHKAKEINWHRKMVRVNKAETRLQQT